MENLFEAYSAGNPPQIRIAIYGWERETNSYEEDIEGQAKSMNFVNDPRNSRGHISLFHQSIHTYWTIKCVLAKALQILQPIEGRPEVISIV